MLVQVKGDTRVYKVLDIIPPEMDADDPTNTYVLEDYGHAHQNDIQEYLEAA